MSAETDPPSARAVERLATGVGEDVADLRTQLHQALERADRLEADGRQDLAVEVLEEQRDVLLEVHRRLEARLAQAAVEREAERVVDAVAVGSEVAAADGETSGSLDEGLALRLVASAAAAVLGVTLLLSPGSGTVDLTAAGSAEAGDAAVADAHGDGGDAAPARDETTAPEGPGGAAAFPATLADGADGAARPTDLRALPIPTPHVLAATSDDEDDEDDDAGLARLTGPLPPPDPGLEQLPPEPLDLPESEGEDDADEGDGDGDAGDEAEPADDGESELLGR